MTTLFSNIETIVLFIMGLAFLLLGAFSHAIPVLQDKKNVRSALMTVGGAFLVFAVALVIAQDITPGGDRSLLNTLKQWILDLLTVPIQGSLGASQVLAAIPIFLL